MTKLTITDARRRIASLEAEVERLTKIEADPTNALQEYAARMREIVDFVPERPRYVGQAEKTECVKLEDALDDIAADLWDADLRRGVVELCTRAGQRPASGAAEDVAEAVESLLYKYR